MPIYLVHKPSGPSSFHPIRLLRKKFPQQKIGHEGTLDPFAEGLLIIFVGNATKIIPYVSDVEKRYRATLKLGQQTDTGDLTGKVVKEQEYDVDINRIKRVLDTFIGDQEQTPPMYSAKSQDGVRLYQLARQGITVERKKSKINIAAINLIDYQDGIIRFEVTCSRGTYVRTLAEDIAVQLGTVGHLVKLERIAIGKWQVGQAKLAEEIEPNDAISLAEFLNWPAVVVNSEEEKLVRNGCLLRLNNSAEQVLVVDVHHQPLALYGKIEEGYQILRGLWQ